MHFMQTSLVVIKELRVKLTTLIIDQYSIRLLANQSGCDQESGFVNISTRYGILQKSLTMVNVLKFLILFVYQKAAADPARVLGSSFEPPLTQNYFFYYFIFQYHRLICTFVVCMQ